MPRPQATARPPDAHDLRTLIASALGNLQLARQALLVGALDRPIAAWLRTAEQDMRTIAALPPAAPDEERG